MKRSFIITAIALGVYYLVREILGKEEETTVVARKKHLTTAFSKAKDHAVKAATE